MRFKKLWMALAASAFAAVVLGGATAAAHDPDQPHPGLSPATVENVVTPGTSFDVEKTVHTPSIPQTPDIMFLADITGSMGSAIAAVQGSAAAVLIAVDGATTDPRYGAASYSDIPDPLFFLNAAIPAADDDGAAALAAIAGWATLFGGDGPESQLYALHRLAAHSDAAFRAGSTRIVVWFGDAPGHDPVCDAVSADLGHNVSEASVTAELVAAGIKVIAISTLTGYPAGLDDDPGIGGGSYVGPCGSEGGSAGQATRIAAATGGVAIPGITNDAIAAAILDGLGNVSVKVEMASTCEAPITTTFAPASQVVTSGDDAVFTETISVAAGAPDGVYQCRDYALIDGEPMTDSAGAVIYEEKTITVDGTPPVAVCTPADNPAGPTNVPKAPGNGGQGQNQDGFYIVGARDALDGVVSVTLVDKGADGALGGGDDYTFGSYPSGTKVKYTEANGATPNAKPGSGDVNWKLQGQGDLAVVATDALGNTSHVQCKVPPPPK